MDLTALSEEYRTAADRLQERLRELRVFAQTARGVERVDPPLRGERQIGRAHV